MDGFGIFLLFFKKSGGIDRPVMKVVFGERDMDCKSLYLGFLYTLTYLTGGNN